MKRRTFFSTIPAILAAIPFLSIGGKDDARKPNAVDSRPIINRKNTEITAVDYPVWGTDGDDVYELYAPGEETEALFLFTLVFIPENEHDIWVGYWTHGALVNLLRNVAGNPASVQFVADMME